MCAGINWNGVLHTLDTMGGIYNPAELLSTRCNRSIIDLSSLQVHHCISHQMKYQAKYDACNLQLIWQMPFK